MKRRISCVCFHADAKVDKMMHLVDMFEPFKALSIPNSYDLELKEGCSDEKALSDFKMAMEKCESPQRVTAIFIPNKKEGAWKDESVKMISNGHKFGRFEDVLFAHGYVADKKESI